MTHDALLTEWDRCRHWLDGCRACGTPMAEQLDALEAGDALAAALRATQPSERVASLQVDLDELERLRAANRHNAAEVERITHAFPRGDTRRDDLLRLAACIRDGKEYHHA